MVLSCQCRPESTGNSNGWCAPNPKALNGFGSDRPLSLEKTVFPGLVGHGLSGYEAPGPLLDIGTPDRYDRAKRELMQLMGQGEG